MRRPKLVHAALAVAVSFALSACAGGHVQSSASEEAEGGGDAVAIHIDNDLSPPSSVTIYMVPESGGRERLGVVNGATTHTFSFGPQSRSMEFQLTGEVVGERDIASTRFTLVDASRVEWTLSRPQVRVIR